MVEKKEFFLSNIPMFLSQPKLDLNKFFLKYKIVYFLVGRSYTSVVDTVAHEINSRSFPNSEICGAYRIPVQTSHLTDRKNKFAAENSGRFEDS